MARVYASQRISGNDVERAIAKKSSQLRQRERKISARHAAAAITTRKVWAWISGKRPAATPAISIRRVEMDCGSAGAATEVAFCFFASGALFLPATALWPAKQISSCEIAIHHWQKTKMASGNPKRMLRCGTKSVISEFPQRRMLLGRLMMV